MKDNVVVPRRIARGCALMAIGVISVALSLGPNGSRQPIHQTSMSSVATTSEAAVLATFKKPNRLLSIIIVHINQKTKAIDYYTIRPGDSLSTVAGLFYHANRAWFGLYCANRKEIGSNPGLLYPGEKIYIPATPKTSCGLAQTISVGSPAHNVPPSSSSATLTSSPGSLSGTLGCSGLERLWKAARGNPTYALLAAKVAMAESGGNQYAHSPTNDFGYWQINASNGALATYNAMGNARAAIILSHNGTRWSAWTTYTSGAYANKC